MWSQEGCDLSTVHASVRAYLYQGHVQPRNGLVVLKNNNSPAAAGIYSDAFRHQLWLQQQQQVLLLPLAQSHTEMGVHPVQ